ncbi:MAG: nif11-like peptide radical SAM maturase, partial [Candidatus Eremiobacterota bacterium]
NIEEMSAAGIDDDTAGIIERCASDPAAIPEPPEELAKLGLLQKDTGKTPKVKKNIEPSPVVNMCLFLTQSCNLKCVYCYGEGGEYGTGGNMEEKTAFQAVDWMIEQSGKMKKVHTGFFGGEPFLRFPLMKSIVEYARKKTGDAGKKVDFHLTTNGTLLDDEKIAFIKENNINAMISFDGTKELQDTQRPYANGEGSYDSTVPKIKKLLELLPETPGHAVIVGDTDPATVKEAMKEIGFKTISVMPASRSLFAEDKKKSARDTENLIHDLEHEAETWVNLIRDRDSKALKGLKERGTLYYGIMSLLHNSKKRHACGAGLGLVGVSCAGDIYLCHRFVGQDEYKLGSVFEKHLNREEYQKSPLTVNKLCASCFAKYYCGGGCKHDNAGVCGSISEPSEDMCRIRLRELELSATITSGLNDEDRAFLVEKDIFPPKPCPFDF